jgi:hypothetical protein
MSLTYARFSHQKFQFICIHIVILLIYKNAPCFMEKSSAFTSGAKQRQPQIEDRWHKGVSFWPRMNHVACAFPAFYGLGLPRFFTFPLPHYFGSRYDIMHVTCVVILVTVYIHLRLVLNCVCLYCVSRVQHLTALLSVIMHSLVIVHMHSIHGTWIHILYRHST